MTQYTDYTKIKYKDYILFPKTTVLTCPYPRDGDVLGVCILRNEKDKYKKRTEKSAWQSFNMEHEECGEYVQNV